MFKRDGITYTENFKGHHRLPPEKLDELKAHFHQCDEPFLSDDLCFRLFEDIGYDEYAKLVEPYRDEVLKDL